MTYITQSIDFTLYLEDYLKKKCHTFDTPVCPVFHDSVIFLITRRLFDGEMFLLDYKFHVTR